MSEKVDAKESPFTKQVNMSKLDAPIICPLLSMASPQEDEYIDCMKEACWFYSRKMKMCAIVIQALAQSNIATHLTTPTIKRDFESVKRQHRSIE